jgi:hypothetical protein
MTFRPDPKPVRHRNRKLLDVIRELSCVDCGATDGTVVAAHSNQFKGLAIKSPDSLSCALCFACHARLDQGGTMTKDERRAYEKEMNHRTLIALVESGILHT